MLSIEEQRRYARHLALPEVGRAGQEKLKRSAVLVVGAGGLGCACLQYLAASGIGRLGIVDHDIVDLSNLQRQILYTDHSIGAPKVTAAKEALTKLNPHVEIISYQQQFSEELAPSYDLVIDATDNFKTKYLINDTCVQLDIPLITASLAQFSGQLALFEGKRGPNYRHLFPEPPEEALSCAAGGVLGVLPGIMGALQALEAVKYIAGIGKSLAGKLLLLDGLTYQVKIFSLTEVIMSEEKWEVTYEEWQKMPDAQLIDVREKEERLERNIGGEWIPLGTLPEQINLVARDKDVVLYCQSGRRSLHAAKFLRETLKKGNIYSLKGGLKGV